MTVIRENECTYSGLLRHRRDGIPDELQALTAVQRVEGAIAGAADAVGGRVTGLFKLKKRG